MEFDFESGGGRRGEERERRGAEGDWGGETARRPLAALVAPHPRPCPPRRGLQFLSTDDARTVLSGRARRRRRRRRESSGLRLWRGHGRPRGLPAPGGGAAKCGEPAREMGMGRTERGFCVHEIFFVGLGKRCATITSAPHGLGNARRGRVFFQRERVHGDGPTIESRPQSAGIPRGRLPIPHGPGPDLEHGDTMRTTPHPPRLRARSEGRKSATRHLRVFRWSYC
jgi:hypothetical protein